MDSLLHSENDYVVSFEKSKKGIAKQKEIAIKQIIVPEVVNTMARNFDCTEENSLNILTVGSGFGDLDIIFLHELLHRMPNSNKLRIKCTVVEKLSAFLLRFRDKVEQDKKLQQHVDFTWVLDDCESFLRDYLGDDGQPFHIINMWDVLYYMDYEKVLEQSMDSLLFTGGSIVSLISCYNGIFNGLGLKVLCKIHGIFKTFPTLTDKSLIDLAKRNNWKYRSFHGNMQLDVTDIFEPTTAQGRVLLDFYLHKQNAIENVSEQQLEDVVQYFRERCYVNDCRSFVNSAYGIVMYFK